MENSALLLLVIVVVVVVIVVVVFALWPKPEVVYAPLHSRTSSTSEPPAPASGSLQDLNMQLGKAMFRLIEAINTAEYRIIRDEVDRLVSEISTKVCRSRNREDLIKLYHEQINLIVEHCKVSIDHEFNQSNFSVTEEHTPTGTHTPASSSGCEVNSTLARIRAQLTLSTAGIASVMAECTGTSTKSLEVLLGSCASALVKYNTIRNIEGHKIRAENFMSKYLPLWEKLRSQ